MRFVLLLIAAVVAIVAGVAALRLSNKTPAPVTQQTPAPIQQEVSTADVLVARVPIDVGTVIDESMIDRQPWPQHLVLDGFIISGDSNSNIIGKVTRAPFQAREPFLSSKLANPNDPSFLAAALPGGKRAVTIATDSVAGVAGYIFPGDRVDIIFTHNVPEELRNLAEHGTASNGADKPLVTEVMLSNVRVLAVNLRESGGKAQPVSPSSITLEASDADVQKLRLAEKQGTLSLALRSLKDKDNTTVPDPSMLGSLTKVHLEETEGDEVKVVRGSGASKSSGPANLGYGMPSMAPPMPYTGPGVR